MTVSGMREVAGPITPIEVARPAAVPDEEKRLRKSAADLEGLFVAQLYKAMRATVPQGEGIVTGGSGEELFTGLMDEHIAADTPKHWSGGISEALYRQLRRALPVSATPVASAENAEPQKSAAQAMQSSVPLAR